MYRTVLVPLDGSALAEQALHQIPHIACDRPLVYLVRVIQPPAPEIRPEGVPTPPFTDALALQRQEALAYLKGVAAVLQSQGMDVRPQVLVDPRPADAILAFAAEKGVDLIIMSTHGLGGMSRWIFGSVTTDVVRHAPCPVLVVRPT